MARKITKLGHTVKGALAAYIAPRLAADAAFKPGELDALLKSVKVAPFKEQAPLIADAAKAAFKDRIAKDADFEDLGELLEALGEAEEGDDEEGLDRQLAGDEDDGVATDSPEEHGKALMELLSKLDIPPDALEQINAHVNGMCAKPAEPGAGDEFPPKKPAVPAAPNAAPMKEVPVSKPAMDAAIKKATDEVAKKTQERLVALYDAAAAVKPYVGDINPLAFDSADAIYKMTLDANQVDTKDVHPSAYRSLLRLIGGQQAQRPEAALAADAASAQDFEKRYTHIPARA